MDLTTSKASLRARSEEIGVGLADFLSGLWELMESLEPFAWQPTDAADVWDKVQEENSFYFAFDAPELTSAYFSAAFARIFDYVAPATPGVGAQTQAELKTIVGELTDDEVRGGLVDATKLMRLITGRLADRLKATAGKGKEEGDDPLAAAAAVHLTVISALTPTATAATAQLTISEHLAPALKDGHCPVCGRPADVGVIREAAQGEGGRRELWCSFCGAIWNFERIRCTRCGTRAQSELSFHFNEGDRARRVYYCKACGGAQKVIALRDLPKTDDFDVRVESIAMAGLEDAVRSHAERLFAAMPAGLEVATDEACDDQSSRAGD